MQTPEIPINQEKIDAAFLQASRKVVERAINTGTPVIIWEDGALKEVDPSTYLNGPLFAPPVEKQGPTTDS
ncbi:MAG: hypothetical protein R3B84_21755 [Zavarzinella sp.]